VNDPSRDRVQQTQRKRFRAEEQQAIDAVARWVGHHAVRSVIENRRAGAEQAVAPISRLLTDQIAVMFFCLHLFGLTMVEPGWQRRRAPTWMLHADELKAIDQVKADFRAILQVTASEVKQAGVGVVPSWPGDLVVIGELLLLGVNWELPARELAEALQPPAIGAIEIDASGTTHRRGSGARASNNIGALRRDYEHHLYGPPPRAPYARGGRRAVPEATRQRRQALAKVCERWPDITASQLYTTFGDHGVERGGRARTPGGYLRQLLEQIAAPAATVQRPSKSTLYEDLKALRVESRDQKPSG
jgi:hypothetical protein